MRISPFSSSMFEFIAAIIFVISAGAIFAILLRKIPILITLPQNGTTGIKKHSIILDAEKKIAAWFLSFKKMVWLHKVLSWVKIMTLKTEVSVDKLLHGIRKKAQKIDDEMKEKR